MNIVDSVVDVEICLLYKGGKTDAQGRNAASERPIASGHLGVARCYSV